MVDARVPGKDGEDDTKPGGKTLVKVTWKVWG